MVSLFFMSIIFHHVLLTVYVLSNMGFLSHMILNYLASIYGRDYHFVLLVSGIKTQNKELAWKLQRQLRELGGRNNEQSKILR